MELKQLAIALLLLVLQTGATTSGQLLEILQSWSADPLGFKDEDCPAWIADFAQSQQTLLAPGNITSTRFFLYQCGSTHNCFGIGDRVRAMEEAVKLAWVSGRAVLFSWEHPAPLERFFEPTLIDWRLKPEYGLPSNITVDYLWEDRVPPPKELTDGSFITAQASRKVLTMSTNIIDAQGLLPGPNLGVWNSNERSCLLRALMKPTEEVTRQVAVQQEALFGSSDTPYVAIHLRLGGYSGEHMDMNRFDSFKGLLSTLACAQGVATHNNITAPILLMTDNAMLRRMVARRRFRGVVGPKTMAHYFGANGESMDKYLTNFVDLGLLADARCFVATQSGFGALAAKMGRHQCYTDMEQCFKTFYKE